MKLKERMHKLKRLLTLNQPMDVTDEAWDAVLAAHRAEKERQSMIRQYLVDHYRETPEYRNAGVFKRLIMSLDYELFLDCRGQAGFPTDHKDRMQALLDELGEETEALARMSHTDRQAYFRRLKLFRDLAFDVDCDTTILHVTTRFEGVTDETVAETVLRIAGQTQS